MQVVINLQPLLGPLTGIGHYTRELTLGLVEHSASGKTPVPLTLNGLTNRGVAPLGIDHRLLTPPVAISTKKSPRRDPKQGLRRPEFRRIARRYLRNSLTRKAYRWWYDEQLRRYARRAPSSLYWEPNYVLLPWQGASVMTVHDLSHERYPEFHPHERVEFFNRHLPESLARASRINVVSHFTAQELHNLHGVDSSRIDVVSPGVSERFFRVDDQQRQRVRTAYSLPERYCLGVGTLEPRKNLARLMQAFIAQPIQRQRECPLLLAGMAGWGEQAYSRPVQQAFTDGRIRLLGYVADADLPALYANATLFAYVSLYEGFGMPVIEAMAAGVPVLTADATATREVAGDAALCVDPEDIQALLDGLERLQNDSALASRLNRAGPLRAAQFTWQRSCQALLASFQHALDH